jgi:hypothetical protein
MTASAGPVAFGRPPARPPLIGARWNAWDARRRLQLALAGLWLLDAALQFQPFMFTNGFAGNLAVTAAGNPPVVAGLITWAARVAGQHAAAANAVFATVQLLIALGIAWRPTVKMALGASVAWAVAVWWLGEGLGGVLTGTASPVTGAPGAAILYGLLAVLRQPGCRPRPAPRTWRCGPAAMTCGSAGSWRGARRWLR